MKHASMLERVSFSLPKSQHSPLFWQGMLNMMIDHYEGIDGMEDLCKEVRDAGYEMHILSNYPCWWRHIENKLELSRYMEWSFISCQTGVRKPDPLAFEVAANSLNVRPSDCLFVDNDKKNCDAAEYVGMPAIHFQSAEDLRKAFSRRLGYM